MNLENKFIQFLVRYRITIMLSVWGTLFFVGFNAGIIACVVAKHFGSEEILSQLVPTVFFIVPLFLLIFYMFTGILKYKMHKNSLPIEKDETETLELYNKDLLFGNNKLRIFFGCWCSFIGSILLITILSFPFGYYDDLSSVLSLYVFFGWIIWFPLSWKFFNKQLK